VTRIALLVVDAISDFEHEDGEVLLASFRRRLAGFADALVGARRRDVPVIYVNDRNGRWNGDRRTLVKHALEGKGADVVSVVKPQTTDAFLFKSRYSAFDHTDLAILLEEIKIERVLLIGAATERCLVQTAIDARELRLQVTILAEACATVDEEMEGLALRYAEQVVGAAVMRGQNSGAGYD
jgi:nicotinamidase-related amidase